MKQENIAITNPQKIVGGESYEKIRVYSVTHKSCIPVDHRMGLIRQESDQLVSVFGQRYIAASVSTVCSQREDVEMKILKKSEEFLARASALQLCYDGKIILKIDRCVFVGRFVNA